MAMRAILTGLLGGVLILALAAPAPAAAQDAPVEVRLILDRSAYEPGVPIGFTVQVRNISALPVTLGFSTAQRFDLVLRSETVELDRWSRTQTFASMPGQMRLARGEIATFSGSWLPASALLPSVIPDAGAQPIPRGVFQIVAVLRAIDAPIASRPQPLIIGPANILNAGCTTLPSLFTLELPAEAVAQTVDPPEALISLWQRSLFGAYTGYQPHRAVASDLRVINRLNPLTICLALPARVILP